MTTQTEQATLDAMILGRTLFDYLRKPPLKYTLEQCITVGNEIKKGVYDVRERLSNLEKES